MRQFMEAMPGLPGLATALSTRATWPVWSGSTTAKVKFQPVGKKEAARLYHRVLEFERQTRQPGKQDGAITRNGLAIIRALLFDFLNFRTGQLDPAYEAIAHAACISVRSVARGLQALKEAGVLFWQRRCKPRVNDAGDFLMEQDSNAYSVRPASQWRGYTGKPEAPAPEPGTWGDHPCGTRDALTEALAEGPGASLASVLQQLENDPADGLAAVLARLGRAIETVKSPDFIESARLAEKHTDG